MEKPTIKDIANKAGVSIATVSRVLNRKGYISSSMIEKVLTAAEELNYYPNDVAKSLKTSKTNTIGVVIPDISNPFFMSISKGLEDALTGTKYSLIFTSGSEDEEKEKWLLRLLIERRVDGLVLATTGLNVELINNILKSNIPIILVDRKITGLTNEIDSVTENNYEGAFRITEKLINEGHSKIGVIAGLLKVSTGADRYAGFKKKMELNSLEIKPEYIYYGDFSEQAGKNAVKYFLSLDSPPSAILSLNNTMTQGAVKELIGPKRHSTGIHTVGSYGEIEFQNYLKDITIYSVLQSPYEMGIEAGTLMKQRLEDDISTNKPSENICFSPNFSF